MKMITKVVLIDDIEQIVILEEWLLDENGNEKMKVDRYGYRYQDIKYISCGGVVINKNSKPIGADNDFIGVEEFTL